MLTFAYYLLKVSVCSGVLFSYYFFMLRNKRFHQYNRFYLLSAVVLSFIIPVAKIQFWNNTAHEMPAVTLLKVVATRDAIVEESLKSASVFSDLNSFALAIFSLISATFLVSLGIEIIKVVLLIRSNPNKSWNNIDFIMTEAKGTPFSFFKYIFWNKNIDLHTEEGKQILQHELTHVHEKHSADKLFLNIILIIGWLNPFFWLIRKELNMIHEFIADEKAISDGDAASFSAMLLKTAYPQHSFVLANSLFHSPIKRRLIMFTTSKNIHYSYLRKIMILPLLAFVVVFFVLKSKGQTSKRNNPDKAPSAKSDVNTNKIRNVNVTREEKTDTNIKTKGFSPSTAEIIADTEANSKSNDTSITNERITVYEAQMRWKNLYTKDSTSEQISNFLLNKLASERQMGKQADPEIIKFLEDVVVKRIAEEHKEEGIIGASDTIEAKFPGGDEAWKKYLETNLDANVSVVKDKAPAGVYTTKIQFIVTETGEIKDVSAIKIPEHCPSCAIEAVRMIKLGPKWDPMTIDGKKVNSKQVQFVSFMVAEK